MTTVESSTSQVNLITKIQVPQSFSTRATNKTVAKSPKPVLEGADVEGVNGKFSKVYGKVLNNASYYRNAAGFEISLQNGGQFWAIRGPNEGLYYWASVDATTSSPPTVWHPHTLSKGQPVLRMELEKEAGDVTEMTPRSVKVSSEGSGEGAKENAYPAATPFSEKEGNTPVMSMNFMQTPGGPATPSRTPVTLADHIRENSISESLTRGSRRTSCYDDNEPVDAVASPLQSGAQPPQTIPVTQPTKPSPMPAAWAPPAWATQPRPQTHQMARGAVPGAPLAQLQMNTAQVNTAGIPVAPAGHIYIPQPIQVQGSPMLMATHVPYHTQLLPVNAGFALAQASSTVALHAGARQAIANSPGLQQLQNQLYTNMAGFATQAVQTQAAYMPQTQQIVYKDGIWPMLAASGAVAPPPPQPTRQQLEPARRRSGSHPPGFTPRPDEEPTVTAAASVSDLGGEPLTGPMLMERPRTASAGAIAPPSSSEEPKALPRFYRVVVDNGITYRMTNDIEDKFVGQVAAKGEVIDVEEHDGSFVRCRNGLWLPKHYGIGKDGVTLLEPCDKDVVVYKVLLQPGLSYRKSMDMGDKSKRAFAPAQSEVLVYKVEGNWAYIPGGHFLPMIVSHDGQHYPALERMQPIAAGHLAAPRKQSQDGMSSCSNSMNGSIEIISTGQNSDSPGLENAMMPQPIARNESNYSTYSG